MVVLDGALMVAIVLLIALALGLTVTTDKKEK